MKKIILSIAVLLLIIPVGYCQNHSSRPTLKISEPDKEQICAQQLDFVLEQLKVLANKYPVLASFEKDVGIDKSSDSLGMSYGFNFSNNFHLLKPGGGRIDSKLPYVYISFYLRPSRLYTVQPQGGTASIAEYISQGWEGPMTFGRFNSGVIISGSVYSDNESLKKEIHRIFDEVIHRILEWEKSVPK